MFAYKADRDFNLSTSKASVIFTSKPHTPRNDAEAEMLEEAFKAWKIARIWTEEKEKREVVIESKEKDEDLELVQKMYEEKIGKLPPNKKNDKEWLLSKLAE